MQDSGQNCGKITGEENVNESDTHLEAKFLDAGIQDVSTSILIEFKIEHLDELIEMSVDDESDTHVEARYRRYS